MLYNMPMDCFVFALCGAVLYHDPRTFLRTLWRDGERALRLYDIVFQSPERRMLEEGSLTKAEALEWLCRRTPGDAEHIRLVLRHWQRCLTPRWETVELLLDMKEQGKRLYFSAAADTDAKMHIMNTYPFVALFEGGVFSCDAQSRTMAEELVSVYRLVPEGCVWIDTDRSRLSEAEAAGFRGIFFSGAERLRDTFI